MMRLAPRERLFLLGVFVLAALIRFSFWSELRGTPLDQWQRFDQSDMATYVEQARRIEAGDLLQPEPYHPYHAWQSVAPPVKWLAWYGPHSFHQAPAYSYMLAALEPVAGRDFALVKVIQLLLGAGSCALVFLIAHHLAGSSAALAAGLIAAVYGPLLFLEAQLLREGPALFWILAVVFALMRHLDREEATTRRLVLTCAGLGIAVGAFATFHEMANVLMLVVLISLAVGHFRAGWRRAGTAVACALCGWLIGFAPLLARNLAVGAPPLSVSCRTVINFVESNVADALDGGATFVPPGPSVARILDEAEGSGLSALQGVWKSYRGDFGLVLENLFAKFRGNFLPIEIPDNTSFDFYRDHATTLRFAPTFRVLFPLGLAGILATAWRISRRSKQTVELTKKERKRMQCEGQEPETLRDFFEGKLSSHLVLLLLLLGLISSLSLVHTVARFRMYLVPIFIVYAGLGVAMALHSMKEKRYAAAMALGVIAIVGSLLQHSIPVSDLVHSVRPLDYIIAAKISIEDKQLDEARRYAEEGIAKIPGDSTVAANVGREFEIAGHRELAIDHYRRALAIQPLQRLRAN